MNQGIAVAGNMIVDVIKTISVFPERHGLVKIQSISRALGGAVNNVIQDLARLDPAMPLKAVGLIGHDPEGDEIRRTLSAYANIDLSHVGYTNRTSFTDVLSEAENKARTFLVYPGASADLDIGHFDFDTLKCDILHIGYILLLDTLDAPDAAYGTRMAHLLHKAQSHGILTSVDVVSEVGNRYKTLVPPSLKYTDYLIINEIEAGKTCGIDLRDAQGALLVERIFGVLRALKAMGVSRWVVIHAPEGGFGIDEDGVYVQSPSLLLPDGFIAGTVGAGDAFCAGVLHAAYHGENLAQGIEDGIAAAACSLRAAGASESVVTIEETRALADSMPRRTL